MAAQWPSDELAPAPGREQILAPPLERGMIGSERVAVVASPALVYSACAQSKDAAVDSAAAADAAATVTALAEAPDQSFTRGDVVINYRVIGAGASQMRS